MPGTPKGNKKEPEKYTTAYEYPWMVRRIMTSPAVMIDTKVMHRSPDSVRRNPNMTYVC